MKKLLFFLALLTVHYAPVYGDAKPQSSKEVFSCFTNLPELTIAIPEDYVVQAFSPCSGGACGPTSAYIAGSVEDVQRILDNPRSLTDDSEVIDGYFCFTFLENLPYTSDTWSQIYQDLYTNKVKQDPSLKDFITIETSKIVLAHFDTNIIYCTEKENSEKIAIINIDENKILIAAFVSTNEEKQSKIWNDFLEHFQ